MRKEDNEGVAKGRRRTDQPPAEPGAAAPEAAAEQNSAQPAVVRSKTTPLYPNLQEEGVTDEKAPEPSSSGNLELQAEDKLKRPSG